MVDQSRQLNIRNLSAKDLNCSMIQGDPMRTVWIHVNTDALPGDVDLLKVFASDEAAQRWFDKNDPEDVAFEYPVQE
jgi:hypothetical protein